MTVRYETDGPIAIVTIDRLDVANAVDAETAERLNISIEAVKSRLHRARTMMRERLRCAVCGHREACLHHPSWVDAVIGFQQFPGGA